MQAAAEKRIDKGQIKLIHTIKTVLLKAGKITDEEYRIRVQDIHGFSHTSKDLSHAEADQLIKQLEALAVDAGCWERRSGFRSVSSKSYGPLKYSELGDRPGMATPSQLRLIEANWAEVTRYPEGKDRDRALRAMCWRVCKVNDIIFLGRRDVGKMLHAIKSMRHKRGE